MTEKCYTYRLPDENHFQGLCSNRFFGVSDDCYVCTSPVAIAGPTGCASLPSTEVFPAIWRVVSEWNVTGNYAKNDVTTTNNATLYPFLSNVPTGSPAPATATVTRYRPQVSDIVPMDFVRGGTVASASCKWGSISGKELRRRFTPSYGFQSPAVGQCALTQGSTEILSDSVIEGPYLNADGSLSVGCGSHPNQSEDTQTVPLGCNPYPGIGGGTISVITDSPQYSVCFNLTIGSVNNWVFPPQIGPVAILHMTVTAVQVTKISPHIYVIDPGTGAPVWYHGQNSRSARGGDEIGISNEYGHLTGECVWWGEYIAGNKPTVVLNNRYTAGLRMLSPLTLPESVTIMRVG